MTNNTATATAPLAIGSAVITPEGEGWLVMRLSAQAYAYDPKPERYEVELGAPGERRVRREFPVELVEAKPAGTPRESLEEFIARKSSPKWRPAKLPTFRRLPKLSEERFAKLMREQGATGSL